MAVASGLSLDESANLISFGSSAVQVFLVDELWTAAVNAGDTGAARVGHHLEDLIQSLTDRSPEITQIVPRFREELNAYWPQLRDRFNLPEHESIVLQKQIDEYGGLGNLGASLADNFEGQLDAAATELSAKLKELEADGDVPADLSKRIKIAIAVIGLCAVATVLMPVVAGMAGAITMTEALLMAGVGLAGVCATAAGTAIALPDAP